MTTITTPPAAPSISPATLTKQVLLDTGRHYFVRNNTHRPLTLPDGETPLLRYARIEYDVGPGEEVAVPFPVIALYFGDPRSQNIVVEAEDSLGVHRVPTRESELLRLSVFYGIYQQGVKQLHAHIPDVSIFTLDHIEIIPPCFDPKGEHVYGFKKSLHKNDDIATIISDLQDQIDSLKSREDARADNDGELVEDVPRMP